MQLPRTALGARRRQREAARPQVVLGGGVHLGLRRRAGRRRLAERAVVAAGAPWFMTLFGRDSLLTSWMALLVDPELALGTLQTLARYQGTAYDPLSEEEPGRIPHELRWGGPGALARGESGLYYGTVDATPLWLVLLGATSWRSSALRSRRRAWSAGSV